MQAKIEPTDSRIGEILVQVQPCDQRIRIRLLQVGGVAAGGLLITGRAVWSGKSMKAWSSQASASWSCAPSAGYGAFSASDR